MKVIFHKVGQNRYSLFFTNGISQTDYHFESMQALNSFCVQNRINLMRLLTDENAIESHQPKVKI